MALFRTAQRIVNSYDAGIVAPQNKVSFVAGIGIDIPIFEGFRVTNEVREARANLQKLQDQLALLRQAVALEIQSTCLNLTKAQEQFKSTLEASRAATENRELNVRAYQEALAPGNSSWQQEVAESGVLASRAPGVTYVGATLDAVKYAVGSGAYRFSTRGTAPTGGRGSK